MSVSTSIIYINTQNPQKMLKKHLQKYHQLPILPNPQPSPHTQFYDQLIINTQNFSHPGTNTLLTPWQNKNIEQVFTARNHSFNAKLMLVNLCVGRRSEQAGAGYQLFREVGESRLSVLHERVMGGIDLQRGVLGQVAKLGEQEIQAFVSVPKYFTNSNQIKFKDSQWQEFLYKDRFWVSTFVFTVVFVILASYLYSHDALLNDFTKIVLFGVGMITWTIIQYYFHRVMLHVPIKTGKIINGHYIHHAFPNLRNKLALSISKNLTYQLLAYLLLVHIAKLNQYNVIQYILGLHFLMIFYDVLHYYFHFGPELNLPILSYLKKNHMKHHFRDPNRGFGVTTVFWDWVFGTLHVL